MQSTQLLETISHIMLAQKQDLHSQLFDHETRIGDIHLKLWRYVQFLFCLEMCKDYERSCLGEGGTFISIFTQAS